MSSPPKKARIPNKTAICIKIFFLAGNLKVKKPKIEMGNPKNAGIKEVTDELWDKTETKKPQKIKKRP